MGVMQRSFCQRHGWRRIELFSRLELISLTIFALVWWRRHMPNTVDLPSDVNIQKSTFKFYLSNTERTSTLNFPSKSSKFNYKLDSGNSLSNQFQFDHHVDWLFIRQVKEHRSSQDQNDCHPNLICWRSTQTMRRICSRWLS